MCIQCNRCGVWSPETKLDLCPTCYIKETTVSKESGGFFVQDKKGKVLELGQLYDVTITSNNK